MPAQIDNMEVFNNTEILSAQTNQINEQRPTAMNMDNDFYEESLVATCNLLYKQVYREQPELAPKIVGMWKYEGLQFCDELLHDYARFDEILEQSVEVLLAHHAKINEPLEARVISTLEEAPEFTPGMCYNELVKQGKTKFTLEDIETIANFEQIFLSKQALINEDALKWYRMLNDINGEGIDLTLKQIENFLKLERLWTFEQLTQFNHRDRCFRPAPLRRTPKEWEVIRQRSAAVLNRTPIKEVQEKFSLASECLDTYGEEKDKFKEKHLSVANVKIRNKKEWYLLKNPDITIERMYEEDLVQAILAARRVNNEYIMAYDPNVEPNQSLFIESLRDDQKKNRNDQESQAQLFKCAPKGKKPRLYYSNNKLRMRYGKFKMTRQRTPEDTNWGFEQHAALEIQSWSLPGLGLDTVTNAIKDHLFKSKMGKTLKMAVIMHISTVIVSLIALVYNMFTNSSKISKVLNSIAITMSVTTLIFDIYAALNFQKLTEVTVLADDLIVFVQEKLKGVAQHVMTTDEDEGFDTVLQRVDLEREQTVTDLVSARTVEMSDNINTSVISEDGIMINEVTCQQSPAFIENLVQDLVGKTFEDPTMELIKQLMVPFAQWKPQHSLGNALLYDEIDWTKQETSRDIVKRMMGEKALNEYIGHFREQTETTMGLDAEETHKWKNYEMDRTPTDEARLLDGPMSRVKLNTVACATNSTIVWITTKNQFFIKPFPKFPPVDDLRKTWIIYQNKRGIVVCQEATLENNPTNITHYCRRVIDVLRNMTLYECEQQQPELEVVKAAEACAVYVQSKHNSAQSFKVTQHNLKVHAFTDATIHRSIKIAITLLSTILATTEMFGQDAKGKSILKRFTHAQQCKKAIKETANETMDIVEEVMWELFNISLSPETKASEHFTKNYEALVDFNAKENAYYVRNIVDMYAMRALIKETRERLHTLNFKQRDSNAGLQNLEKTIRVQLDMAEAKMKKINNTIKTSSMRPQTEAVLLYGAHGAGKSHFVTHYLIPKLAQKTDLSPKTYTINLAKGEFFPVASGEHFGVCDEFMAKYDQDPMISYFNSIHSCTPCNLETAFEPKEQPCNLKALIYCSNQPYTKLENVMTHEAIKGFYSRFLSVHFVNVLQKKEHRRNEVPKINYEDVSTYELREYTTDIDDQHTYNMIDEPTANKLQHYDEATNSFDETEYTSTNGLKYKLLTIEQYVAKIAERMEIAQRTVEITRRLAIHHNILDFLASSPTVPTIDDVVKSCSIHGEAVTIREVYIEHYNTQLARIQGEGVTDETELLTKMNEIKLDYQNLRIHGDDVLDHYVVFFGGEPGTGKSHSASKMGEKLSKYLRRPLYDVKGKLEEWTGVINYPGVVVLHDQCYKELEYIQFYDKIPKPCLIINTSNCTVQPITVPAEDIRRQTNGVPMEAMNETSKGFIRRGLQRFINYALTASSATAYELVNPEIKTQPEKQQPGWARRVGIGGALWYGGCLQRRPYNNSYRITSAQGFKKYHVDENNHFQEKNESQIIDDIILGYRKYVDRQGDIPVKMVDIEGLEAVMPANIDVHIISDNIRSLISLTRNVQKLTTAAITGSFRIISQVNPDTDVVKISDRVRHSKFPFSATEYAIDVHATVNEASEIGRKMYRQLMYGDSDFNVVVKCRDFTVVGVNQQIYLYLADGALPEQSFSVIEGEKFATIQYNVVKDNKAVSKPVLEVDYDTYGKWKALGPDYPYLRETLSHSQTQLLIQQIEMLPVPEKAKPSYYKYDYELNTATNVINSKIDFAERKVRLITSYMWSIVLVLIGLCSVTMVVTAIAHYFGEGKPILLKTTCFNKHGVEVDVELKAVVEKVKVAGLDKDALISMQLTVEDARDFIASELDEVMREELRRNQPSMWIDEKYYSLEIHSDPIKKDKKKMNTKKPLVVDKIQGKGGLYDNNKAKTLNHGKMSMNITRVMNDSSIIDKVHNQVFIITNENTGKSLKGVAWKERLIITSAHIMDSGKEKFIATHVNNGLTYRCTPIAHVRDEDLLIIEVDDHKIPQFKDITRYFQDENEQVTFQRVKYRRITQRDVFVDPNSDTRTISVRNNEINGTASTTQLVVPIVREEDNFYLHSNYINYVTYHEINDTLAEQGDCGLPVYGMGTGGGWKVIGFHFGQSGKNVQYATSVTKQQLKQISDSLEQWYDTYSHIDEEPLTVHGMKPEIKDIPVGKVFYEGLNGRHEEVIMSQFAVQLINDAMESTPDCNLTYPCMNGKHTKIVGTTDVGKRSWTAKKKFKETIWSDALDYVPNEKANALVRVAEVEDPSALVLSHTGKPSILMTQMNKFNNEPTSSLTVRKQYLSRAYGILKPVYAKIYGQTTQRNLTECEALNGLVVNPRDTEFGCLERINLDGAVGIEVARMFPGVNTIRDLVEDSNEKGPTGVPLLRFKKTEAAEWVRSMTYMTLAFWTLGQRCEGIVQDNLKAELLKLEKIRTGNTRAFESYPIHITLATRILTGKINAAFKKKREEGHGQIGLDRPHFTQLFNRFRKIGAYGEHGDFQNWDKNVTLEELETAAELMHVMRYPFNPNGADDWWETNDKDGTKYQERIDFHNQLKCLIASIAKSFCLADGLIYIKDKGMNSGCGITTTLNCIINDIRRVGVILQLVDEHNAVIASTSDLKEYHESIRLRSANHKNSEVVLASLENNKNIASAQLHTHDVMSATDWINCGDDKASVINSKYLWLLNFVTYSKAYSTVWGQTYGSPHKDGTIEIVTPIQELNFVSRDFCWDDHNKVVLPTLKMSSINHLFHWITAQTPEQYHNNLLAAFQELVLYGREVYEKYQNLVENVLNYELTQYFGPQHTFKVPVYEELFNDFVQASRFERRGADTVAASTRLNEIVEDEQIRLQQYTTEVLRVPQEHLCTIAKSGKRKDTVIFKNLTKNTTRTFTLDIDKIIIQGRTMIIPDAMFQVVLNTLLGLGFVVSGQPAYNWTQKLWSISCEPKKLPTRVLQQHFAKLGVRFHGVDTISINIKGEQFAREQIKISNVPGATIDPSTPVHTSQITMDIKPHSKDDADKKYREWQAQKDKDREEYRLAEEKRITEFYRKREEDMKKNNLYMNHKPHGLNAALGKETGSSTVVGPGGPPTELMTNKPGEVPAENLSSVRTFQPYQHATQYYHKSTYQKAHEFQKFRTVKVNMGATTNSLVFTCKAFECLNEWMMASIYGDSYFLEGSIEVTITLTSNSGLTGSMVIGTTMMDKASYTEDDLNTAQRKYIDLNSDAKFTFTLTPTNVNTVVTRLVIGSDAAQSELNSHFPMLVGIILGDVQSVYDNKALFAQMHFHSRWGPGLKTANFTKPTLGGGGGETKPSEKTLESIIGSDTYITTDGELAFKELGIPTQVNSHFVQVTQFNSKITVRNIDMTKPSLPTEWEDLNSVIRVTDLEGTSLINQKKKPGDPSISFDGTTLQDTTEMTIKYSPPDLVMDTFALNPDKAPYMTIPALKIPKSNVIFPKYEVSMKEEVEQEGGQQVASKYMLRQIAPNVSYKTDEVDMTFQLEQAGVTASGKIVEGTLRNKSSERYLKAKYAGGHMTSYNGTGNYNVFETFNASETAIFRLDGDVTYELVNQMRNIPQDVSSLPSGCKRVISMDKRRIVPTVGSTLNNGPTIFAHYDLATSLARHYDPTKIWDLAVQDVIYKQNVANLIFHGPEMMVFLRTASEEQGMYAVCKYSAKELIIVSASVLEAGSVLPTTNIAQTWLDRTSQAYREKVSRTRAVISMNHKPHGAALSSAGAGGLAGIGSGLGQYFNMQQMQKFQGELFDKSSALRKELQELLGEQNFTQLITQLEAQQKMQDNQFQHQLLMSGLASPAMQSQLTRSDIKYPPPEDDAGDAPASVTPVAFTPGGVQGGDAELYTEPEAEEEDGATYEWDNHDIIETKNPTLTERFTPISPYHTLTDAPSTSRGEGYEMAKGITHYFDQQHDKQRKKVVKLSKGINVGNPFNYR